MQNTKFLEGIYIPSERKAYFPEAGLTGRANFSVDRVRSMLIQRGLIRHERDQTGRMVPNYQFIKYTEAKELGYELVMVAVSPHVQRALERSRE